MFFHLLRHHLAQTRWWFAVYLVLLTSLVLLPVSWRILSGPFLLFLTAGVAIYLISKILIVHPHESSESYWRSRPITSRQMFISQCFFVGLLLLAAFLCLLVSFFSLEAPGDHFVTLSITWGILATVAFTLVAVYRLSPRFATAVSLSTAGFVLFLGTILIYVAFNIEPSHNHSAIFLFVFFIAAAVILTISCQRRLSLRTRQMGSLAIVVLTTLVLIYLPEGKKLRSKKSVGPTPVLKFLPEAPTNLGIQRASYCSPILIEVPDPSFITALHGIDLQLGKRLVTIGDRATPLRFQKHFLTDAILRNLPAGTSVSHYLFHEDWTTPTIHLSSDQAEKFSHSLRADIAQYRIESLGEIPHDQASTFFHQGIHFKGQVRRTSDGSHRYLLTTESSLNRKTYFGHHDYTPPTDMVVCLHSASAKKAVVVYYGSFRDGDLVSLGSSAEQYRMRVPPATAFGEEVDDLVFHHYLISPAGYDQVPIETPY